jgi:hypothetical protein
MTSSKSGGSPPEPERRLPSESWEHIALYRGVRDALLSLPLYFRTQTVIEGISAVDIFTLNAALGATIENQVVATLNQMRTVWDPQGRYLQYAFVRQAQTFPDVLLRRTGESDGTRTVPLLGIELKSWYLLAKEAEPSFRFTVTADACASQDLIVVVPWALTNVISGSPTVFAPYIESARYAADYRNHHWQHLRDAKGKTGIRSPRDVKPYPRKSDAIGDVPDSDTGGNFGRFARTGLMDAYLAQAKQELLAGIRAEHWLGFFKLFQEQKDRASISSEIEKLRRKLMPSDVSADKQIESALAILSNLEQLLS